MTDETTLSAIANDEKDACPKREAARCAPSEVVSIFDVNGAEIERLAALQRTGLLDTPHEEAFDRLTRLAARLLGAPVALLSLVDHDRQFFKSATGLEGAHAAVRETPRSISFCQHVVARRAPLIIEDAREHPLMRGSQAIHELNVVAYLGVPIVAEGSNVIGALCVNDSKPHAWTQEDVRTLQELSEIAMSEITLRVKAREQETSLGALRESELRFRELTENIKQVFWMVSPNGEVLSYISPAYEQIWGRTCASLHAEPLSWLDAIVAEDRPAAAADFGKAASGKAYDAEYRIARPDGSLRWIHDRGFPVRDPDGKIVRLCGIAEDINERKRAENALRESQRFAESIAENSTSIIYLFDLETGRSVYTNRNAAESLGYSQAQILEMGDNLLSTIIHPEDLPQMARHLAQFAETPDTRVVDFEYRMRHASGDTRWIWGRDTVFKRRPNGAAWQILGTAQDITERKQAEAALDKAHRELIDASRQAGMAEVATSVLHNVGNVLNSVNTSLSIATGKVSQLKTDGLVRIAALLTQHADNLPAFFAEDPQGDRLPKFLTQLAGHFAIERQMVLGELDSLRGNVEHINEIVAMQQSFAGAGGVMETLQLAEVIGDALRMNASAFERHGTHVECELDPALPPLTIDRNKLLLILVNLIRNAKHACDDSGSSDKRVTVRALLNGSDRAQVSVSDNGIGIPPENLTRIFEHGFTTRKSGHGFGLHSSALAASEMGSALSVQSDGPGRGATFTIELPLSPKTP